MLKKATTASAPAFDGSRGSQTAPVLVASTLSSPRSHNQPPRTPAPLFLNERQAAALLGVSTGKFHKLRREPWFPSAIELGPRALRWHREELEEAMRTKAPQRRVLNEPAHLVEDRRQRKGVAVS
jgi:predicted DNA-binding transcriptional regulator AlpA